MQKLTEKFDKAFTFLYSLLFVVTPLLMYHKTSEIFEFNKILFIYFITLIIFTLWISRMIIYKKFIFKNTVLTIPLLLFYTSQVLSTFFSIDQHTSIFGYYGRFNGGLLSITAYLLLYFAFVSNIDFNKPLEKITSFLKISVLASVLVILWGLPSKFGFDLTCFLFTHNLNASCWTSEFQPMIRMFSTLGQPNWLGAYLAVNFFAALYLYFNNLIKKHRFIFIYLGLNIIALIFTGSRSAMLAFGTGILLLIIYLFVTRFKGKSRTEMFSLFKKLFLPLLLVITIAAIIGFVLNRSAISLSKKIEESTGTQTEASQLNPNSTVTDSFEIRRLVWQGGYSVGMSNLLFGTGVETFAYSYNFLRPVQHNVTSEWDFVYNKAHNEFINYFATTGLLGILSYLAIIAIVLSRMLRIKNLEKNKALLIYSLILAYGSLVITNFFGFSTTVINIYFYLIPALSR